MGANPPFRYKVRITDIPCRPGQVCHAALLARCVGAALCVAATVALLRGGTPLPRFFRPRFRLQVHSREVKCVGAMPLAVDGFMLYPKALRLTYRHTNYFLEGAQAACWH